MERQREALAVEGVNVAAISYDTLQTLQHFAERADIKFPLLSDNGSKIIREYGILNESATKGTPYYGIPHPVEYLLGPDRKIRGKYFEPNYRDRFTAGSVLVRQLGVPAGTAKHNVQTDHLKLSAWASDSIVRGGNRFALGLDIELKDLMHVYSPGVENYIAIDWQMEEVGGFTQFEVEYPESHLLHLPVIDEIVPVYEGKFQLLRDIMIGQPNEVRHLLDNENKFTIRGTLKYQACDDKMCYLPIDIPLEWTLDFEQHDRERVPESLRR